MFGDGLRRYKISTAICMAIGAPCHCGGCSRSTSLPAIPLSGAPTASEPSDGKGVPGTDDPAGYPRVERCHDIRPRCFSWSLLSLLLQIKPPSDKRASRRDAAVIIHQARSPYIETAHEAASRKQHAFYPKELEVNMISQQQFASDEVRRLGVLGGMGPMAGASFLERLTALTQAPCDQKHIPTILWSDPRVPDRTDAKLHNGADPLPLLLHGIEQLEKVGASAIAIPCNSAHLWYDELLQHTDLPILNIIDATVDDLHNHGIWRGKIGLMGTAATLEFGMYQKALEAHGFTPVVPTESEIDAYCTKAIKLVKANRIEEAFEPTVQCARLLTERGATAIVLGCTELPLAIPHHRRPELSMPFVDSIDGLAVAAIHWFYGTGLPATSEACCCTTS